MTRLLLAAGVGLVLLACAPPPPVYQPLGGRPGLYDAANDRVFLDPVAIARWDGIAPGMAEWIPAHEEGHRATLHSTVDVDAVGILRLERLAQCWAEWKLGHGPPYTDDTAGYWDCSSTLVAQMGDR